MMKTTMKALNLPPIKYRLKSIEGKQHIFDEIRGKYVRLTPEEWVRQHFVQYLINEKNVPSSFIANEIGINLNGTSKRCDTVIHDVYLTPIALVEYKAPNVPISESVFDQIVRYNMALKVKYLIVSNGLQHYCCQIDYEAKHYAFLPKIPAYEHLI